MTLDLMQEAVGLGYAKNVTVIDMAPEVREVSGRRVGGKLGDVTAIPEAIRYLTPAHVETPRLSARDATHLLALAETNRFIIEPLLLEFLARPTAILFVNDVSMYLQGGPLETVVKLADASETFVANGYYGSYMAFDFGTVLSKVEREKMDLLVSRMDCLLRL